MEYIAIPPYIRQLTGAIVKCVGLVVIIPVAAAFLLSQSLPATLALITSTLIIEYGAAPIGIGLGLHPDHGRVYRHFDHPYPYNTRIIQHHISLKEYT